MTEEDTQYASDSSNSSNEDCPIEFSSEGADPDVNTTATTAAAATAVTPVFLFSSPHLQFRLEASNGQLRLKSCQNSRPKCPLCRTTREKFYCQNCVIAGDFFHSKTSNYERFTDKSMRLFATQQEIAKFKEQIKTKITETVTRRRLKEELRQMKTKIKHMRHLLKTRRERQEQARLSLDKLTSSNRKRVDRLPEYVNKVEKIRVCVETFRHDMRSIRALHTDKRTELGNTRLSLIRSLEDIFPIEEVFPVTPEQSDVMLDCLAEAMRTSYIHGRWVSVEQSGEMQYRIVAPLLAGSGDYTPVYALIATNKEGAAGGELQAAFNISAGLTLITQLIKLIAHITSVPVPIKLSYAEFGVIETSEYRFARKVAKLNLATVSLCLSLGVDPKSIKPRQTVHNVINLVKHILHMGCGAYGVGGTELVESFTEFPYFAPVVPDINVHEWGTEIHREAEELRSLEDNEDPEDNWEPDEDSLQEWESVGAEDLSETALSSSPSDRTIESSPSSASFVSSTWSSLLHWGITSPKSPRK